MKTSRAAGWPVFGPLAYLPSSSTLRGLLTERVALGIATAAFLVAVFWAGLGVIAMPDAVPAGAPADQFSSGRAWVHLEAITQNPSPTGSVENALVRDYIAGAVTALGLTPEIQTTVAVEDEWGTAALVDNVLARLPGSDSTKAVLIVGHYDGIASGPGAGDNKFVPAAMLEALRTLRAQDQLRNDVIFLFSDAEEYGLIGAKAFVEQHPWAKDVGVVFNYDASDGRGPLVLMFTTAGDGWLIDNVDAAKAGIFVKSQQNTERNNGGQDFDVFRRAGYPGLNLNNWTNQAFYHTRLDNLANLDERKLQAYGYSMVQLSERFGELDLDNIPKASDQVYTSMFDKDFVVRYPKAWTWPLSIAAIIGVAAVVGLGLRRRRLDGRAIAKCVSALLGFIVLSTVLVAALWGVITSTHPEADWQQDVDIYQGSLILGGLVAFVVAGFVALLSWAIPRLGVANLQAAILVLVLPVLVFAGLADPWFSYLGLWPLLALTLAFGAWLLIPEKAAGRSRWLAVGAFWLAAVPVLGVFVPLMWRSLYQSTENASVVPVVALVFGLASLVVLIDVVLPARRLWLSGAAVAVGVALLSIGVARSGFTSEQPRPHTLFYSMNADTGAASWVTLNDDADSWISQFVPSDGAQRTTAEAVVGFPASSQPTTVWLPGGAPVWAADAAALDAAAPSVTVLADSRSGDVRTLRLHLRSPRAAPVFGLVTDQTVVGATVEGRAVRVFDGWRFVFVGLSSQGVDLELTLRGTGPVQLVAVDQTQGLPAILASRYGPEPDDSMPAILPPWVRGYPTFVSKTYQIP